MKLEITGLDADKLKDFTKFKLSLFPQQQVEVKKEKPKQKGKNLYKRQLFRIKR